MERQFSQRERERENECIQHFNTSLVETTESSSQTTPNIAIKHYFEQINLFT